jgi:hypothetical protein
MGTNQDLGGGQKPAVSKATGAIESLTREAELALLIAEQEQDALYGDSIRYSRDLSMEAPLNEDGFTLADTVGEQDETLAALLGENEMWTRLVKQKSATDEDVKFWRYLRNRQGWSDRKIAEHVGVARATVVSRLGSTRRRQTEQSHRLAQKLNAARAAYETGARLVDIAGELYEDAGYASAESCYQALRRLFLERRIPIRPRSWKHGKRSRNAPREVYIEYWREQNRRATERRRVEPDKCSAVTREGRQCSRWARRGTQLCNVHAGLTGGPTVWTEAVVLGALRKWALQNGRRPQARDWNHAAVDHPNFRTVYGLFPSWPAAIHAAFHTEGVQPDSEKVAA